MSNFNGFNQIRNFRNLLIIPLFIFLFALCTSQDTKAQCQSGYQSFSFTVQVDGCSYIVELCAKCGVMPYPYPVSIISITLVNNGCVPSLPFDQVVQGVEGQLLNYEFVSEYICPTSVPACEDGTKEVTINHWVCWKVKKVMYMKELHTIILPCDYENKCVEHYSICSKVNGDKIVYQATQISTPVMEGSVNCTKKAWEITEPVGEGESECFVVPTACD